MAKLELQEVKRKVEALTEERVSNQEMLEALDTQRDVATHLVKAAEDRLKAVRDRLAAAEARRLDLERRLAGRHQ